jgi:two-component system, LytTR family, response regulator
MSYRAVVVDDERLSRVALRALLEQRADVEVVGEADCVDAAARLVSELQPDVVFLDVQMPGASGFELFDRVDVTGRVVFVTAYDEYAVRAFEVNALDYLVKPVTHAALERSLGRLVSPEEPEPAPEPPPRRLSLDDVVCLHEGQSIKFVCVRGIVYLAAADDYTEVHLEDGKVALVATSLRQWAQQLPPDRFARTHRVNLVNLAFVDEVVQESGAWTVRLRNLDVSLPMSRRFAQGLKTRLDSTRP